MRVSSVLPQVGSRKPTLVVRVGSKQAYLLSRLNSLTEHVFNVADTHPLYSIQPIKRAWCGGITFNHRI